MNFKSLLKTVTHAAVGGAVTALGTIPAGAPITSGNVIIPALIGAGTSAFSAVSDPKNNNGILHGLLGAIPILAFGLASGTLPATLLPALLSATTSSGSAKMPSTLGL